MKLVHITQNILFTAIAVLAVVQAGYSQATIELQRFRSEVQGETIAFDWSIAEGSHVKAFGVERAGADLQFETIGTVLVRPTHRASTTYSFTDQHPLNGAAFYRLKVMDTSGNVQYCKVVSQALMASASTGR